MSTLDVLIGALGAFVWTLGTVAAAYCLGWLRGNLGLPLGRGIRRPKPKAPTPEEAQVLTEEAVERSVRRQRTKVEEQVRERYANLPRPLQDATVKEIMEKGKELFAR